MNYAKLISSFRRRRYQNLFSRRVLILHVVLFLLPTGVLAQKGNVSMNINNGTTGAFIKEIEKQNQYTLVCRNSVINDQAKVNINSKNEVLNQALTEGLSPLNVSYTLDNNTIVLDSKEALQQKTSEKKIIKGIVLDKNGEPIIGANIIQEGGMGTVTDINGNFTITADPSKLLEISYIGYKKKSVRIGSASTINISLEEDARIMNEVIVIGYGSKTKRDVTSSIGTYKPGDVNVRQVLGVDQML